MMSKGFAANYSEYVSNPPLLQPIAINSHRKKRKESDSTYVESGSPRARAAPSAGVAAGTAATAQCHSAAVGLCEVRFALPELAGRYEGAVALDGELVPGSPFVVLVQVPLAASSARSSPRHDAVAPPRVHG